MRCIIFGFAISQSTLDILSEYVAQNIQSSLTYDHTMLSCPEWSWVWSKQISHWGSWISTYFDADNIRMTLCKRDNSLRKVSVQWLAKGVSECYDDLIELGSAVSSKLSIVRRSYVYWGCILISPSWLFAIWYLFALTTRTPWRHSKPHHTSRLNDVSTSELLL
jgi:hypothetical protein